MASRQKVISPERLKSYNKDVICIIEKDDFIYCKKIVTASRRNSIDSNTPSYEPYLPTAKNGRFYNCSSLECESVKINSITQLASPKSTLKYCFLQISDEAYDCERVKYYNYKNIDKLLFLSNNIPNNKFYLIDCLAYSDGGRVCHKRDSVDSHTKLVDLGNMARPNETNILSQEEFICEQNEDNSVNCDVDKFVPYPDGLKEKDAVKIDVTILLKTDANLVTLSRNCMGSWCGYSGLIRHTRRGFYQPPGGKVFRCYYAQKQQICKELYGSAKNIYNDRDWLSD